MAKILVIDDDPALREMIRQMLERAGYEVAEADNGAAGMAAFRTEPADLVVTDIVMPDQEGIETIVEFRKEFPDVKIIAMSGGGRTGNVDFLTLAKKFGAERTFAKPVDRREFLQAVADCVGTA